MKLVFSQMRRDGRGAEKGVDGVRRTRHGEIYKAFFLVVTQVSGPNGKCELGGGTLGNEN